MIRFLINREKLGLTWEEYETIELAQEGDVKMRRLRPLVARFMVGEDNQPLPLPHWCGTIVIAREWHVPPWEVDGIPLTPWRRMVWRYRMELYLAELNKKIERERTQIRQNFDG